VRRERVISNWALLWENSLRLMKVFLQIVGNIPKNFRMRFAFLVNGNVKNTVIYF